MYYIIAPRKMRRVKLSQYGQSSNPEEFTHWLEQAWNYLDHLGRLDEFNSLPNFGHKAMGNSSLGLAKFSTPPRLEPVSEAPSSHQADARTVAISRPMPRP
jgi:hypothetical protein